MKHVIGKYVDFTQVARSYITDRDVSKIEKKPLQTLPALLQTRTA